MLGNPRAVQQQREDRLCHVSCGHSRDGDVIRSGGAALGHTRSY